MKSNAITAAVVAVAALTGVAASAETFNSYLFDQMKAPAANTRVDVKVEVLRAPREAAVTKPGGIGAPSAKNPAAPRAEKAGASPQTAEADVKTSE